jgi:hypothetical protein
MKKLLVSLLLWLPFSMTWADSSIDELLIRRGARDVKM